MTTLDSHTYKHSAFKHSDSIRLVELLPGPRDSPLACSIIEARKGGNPVYEALSYAWGEPKFPCRMKETKSQTYVNITSNLHDALKVIRYEHTSRILWVDAVCINQVDLEEKGHQVALMGRIFQDAQRVVVWLGRHKGVKTRIIAILEDLKVLLQTWKTHNWGEEKARSRMTRAIARLYALQFFQQAWFTRVWVVQEFCLAQEIQLVAADDIIPMELLTSCITILKDVCEDARTQKNLGIYTQVLQPFTVQMSQLFDYRRKQLLSMDKNKQCRRRPSGISLAYCVVELSRGRECKDERDRLYAMLALAENDLGIEPDYTLSSAEVMTDLATRSLLAGDLFVLHASGISLDHNVELRSFVPDITATTTEPLNAHHLNFSALTNIPIGIELKAKGTLSIDGLRVDRILSLTNNTAQIGSGMLFAYKFESFMYWITTSHGGLWSAVATNATEYSETNAYGFLPPYRSRPLSELFAHCMTLGTGEFSRVSSNFWNDTAYKMFDKKAESYCPDWLEAGILPYLRNRDFFLTEQGYLGIGPSWMQSGDEVVLINGGATAFIFRKMATQEVGPEDEWQLVGDCYLLGWMDGKLCGHTIVDQLSLKQDFHEDATPSDKKVLVRTKFILV